MCKTPPNPRICHPGLNHWAESSILLPTMVNISCFRGRWKPPIANCRMGMGWRVSWTTQMIPLCPELWDLFTLLSQDQTIPEYSLIPPLVPRKVIWQQGQAPFDVKEDSKIWSWVCKARNIVRRASLLQEPDWLDPTSAFLLSCMTNWCKCKH